MTTTKPQSNFRLSLLAGRLLRKMAKQSGLSVTALLEVIIREAAKKRGFI